MKEAKTTDIDLKGRKVLLHDMSLRDGMHAKREQISVEQMVKVATALDDAGVPLIQVTHGGGRGAIPSNTGSLWPAMKNICRQ